MERRELRRILVKEHRTPAVPPREVADIMHPGATLLVHEHPAPDHVCAVLTAVFQTTALHEDGGTALARRAVAWCLAHPDPVEASKLLVARVGARRHHAVSTDIEHLIRGT
jgi:hypothetical protein